MTPQTERAGVFLCGLLAGSACLYIYNRSYAPSSAAESSTVTEDIKDGIEAAIGNTPLIRIKSLSDATGCEILGKAEFLNPGNSPKDRVAKSILERAEREGLIVPHRGDMIYEGTVGSTGISLALLCKAKGYTAHICMPDDQAREKSDLLQSLGAVVERVRPASIVDKNQFVNKARARATEHTNDKERVGRGIFMDQFENEDNWRAHYESTAPEIYAQTAGKMDVFVAGAGTGGTITGIARRLKPLIPGLKIVLADPEGSGLLNKINFGVMFSPTEREGTRKRSQVDTIVEGIGINRLTRNLEAGRALIDEAIRVTDKEAVAMSRYLVEEDGLFLGSSSAVNCTAAVRMAEKLGPGHRIVTILCDVSRQVEDLYVLIFAAGHSTSKQISQPRLSQRLRKRGSTKTIL